jgi:hypothetical protein
MKPRPHRTLIAKRSLRPLSSNQIPQLALRKRHFRLLLLVEVVELRVQGLGEAGHVAPRVQREPGVVAGARSAGFEDEQEGVEARGQGWDRVAEGGWAGGGRAGVVVGGVEEEVGHLVRVGLWLAFVSSVGRMIEGKGRSNGRVPSHSGPE